MQFSSVLWTVLSSDNTVKSSYDFSETQQVAILFSGSVVGVLLRATNFACSLSAIVCHAVFAQYLLDLLGVTNPARKFTCSSSLSLLDR